MGRLFVVELADSDDTQAHLIVCRTCHTHIAHCKDIFVPGEQVLALLNAVNLQVDEVEQSEMQGHDTVQTDVRCVKCGDLLGIKWIKDERVLPAGYTHIDGTYQLLGKKLDHWTLEHQYRNVEPNDFV